MYSDDESLNAGTIWNQAVSQDWKSSPEKPEHILTTYEQSKYANFLISVEYLHSWCLAFQDTHYKKVVSIRRIAIIFDCDKEVVLEYNRQQSKMVSRVVYGKLAYERFLPVMKC